MTASSALPSIYQLRVVLRGISPLIWRRLLVHSDTTLAYLHAILQIVFAWSDEHLHCFHIYGQEYGSSDVQTRHVLLSDLHLHCGERFRYVYDSIAHWECDIRLETRLPLVSRRVYPVCLGGKHAAPPEDGRGALAYMERLDHHRLYPPLEAMGVVADAISTLLEADPQTSVRAALGDLDDLREAVDCLETYQAFQPDHFDRGDINRQLLAWGQEEGAVRCR
jgi:Plasmid pRiA4b ORF-3-like protein